MNLEDLMQHNSIEAQQYYRALTSRLTQLSQTLERQGIQLIKTRIELKDRILKNKELKSQNRRQKRLYVYQKKIFNAFLVDSPDTIFGINKEGLCLFYYPSNEPNKLPVSIFVGNKIQDVMPNCIQNLLRKNMAQMFEKNNAQSFDFELFVRDTYQYYEAKLSPLNEEYALLIIRNVTEKMVAKEAINKSIEYFNYLMQAARFPIMLHDKKGKIIEINREALKILGYQSAHQLKNKNLLQQIIESSDRGRAKRILREAFQSGLSPDPAYFKAKRANGTIINIEAVASIIHYRSQLVVQASFKKISKTVAQKRHLQYLKKYKQRITLEKKLD